MRPLLRFILACFVLVSSCAVAQAPYSFHHVPTREKSAHVLYDSNHQRFYGSVPGENAVYVMSEADGSLMQKINVPSAYGMDLSVDGTRLYVSSTATTLGQAAAQMIFVFDTATLRQVDTIRPTINNVSTFFASQNMAFSLASLSDGKLAYTAGTIGVTGGAVLIYDQATRLVTPIEPANFYSGLLYKASSGNGFVVVSSDSAGEQVNVYDTASGTYSGNAYFSTTNNSDVVMSPDGSMVLLGGHILCDRSLTKVADLAGAGQPSSLAWTSQGSSFSPDGTSIYVASSLNVTVTLPSGGTASYSNPVLYVFSTSTHDLLRTVPLPAGSQAFQTGYQGVAVGSSGKAMLVDQAGFLELDPASASATLPGAYSQSLGGSQVVSPDGGAMSSPAPTTLNGAGFRTGAKVYFGQTPATASYVSTNVLNVQPPAAGAGPVDVSVVFPDGWALLASQAYSYGPAFDAQAQQAGSTAGGNSVTLYGHGLDAASGSTVLVGGRTASVTASGANYITFTTPAGAAGPVNIEITSAYGSTMLPNGFLYVSQQLIPTLQPYQMAVDNARKQLYVADANSGSLVAVDTGTLVSRTLFTPPSGVITSVVMTPDGSELLAANADAGTIDIVDPVSGKDVKTIDLNQGDGSSSLYIANLVATSNGTALVAMVDLSLYDYASILELDLSSGFTTVVEQQVFAGVLFAPSADGKLIYVAISSADGSSGGAAELWSSDSHSYIKSSEVGEYGPFDLSTSDIGDRVMDECYTSDQTDNWLRFATVCSPDSRTTASRYLVPGVRLHSSGSLGYLPTTKGVEIFDIHHGQSVMMLGDTAGSLEGPANLAISHDGSLLYVAQPDGIGVFTLPSAPLSIGSLTPANGDAIGGESVVLRGSGFMQGTTVTVDGKAATVQYVDATQLLLTMPAVTVAKDTVSVTNPDGNVYSLDAAWDASADTTSPATLVSVSPASADTGATVTFTIQGSGFTPDAAAYLNGVAGATQFVNPGEITTSFARLPGPGVQSLTVENLPNPAQSNSLTIATSTESPNLSALEPSTIPAGSPSFKLSVYSNVTLAAGSVVRWNGKPLASQVVATNHADAIVPASLISTQGTASITFMTPNVTPSISNSQTFTITPGVVAIGISKSSIALGPVLEGGSANTSFTIMATGALPLTISSLASSNSNFAVSGCVGTLNQGASCAVTVVYTPHNRSGLQGESSQLTITSNAPGQATLLLVGTSGDLVFNPGSTQISVKAGGSVTDTVSVTSYGQIQAFSAQLSCTGLPANSTCGLSPTSFSMASVSGIGNDSANFTVTIATQAPTNGALKVPSLGRSTGLVVAGLLFFILPWRRRPTFLGCLFACLLACLVGCGSGNQTGTGGGTSGGGTGTGGGTASGGTPAGSYPVTVTATVPGVTPFTTVITVVVQ